MPPCVHSYSTIDACDFTVPSLPCSNRQAGFTETLSGISPTSEGDLFCVYCLKKCISHTRIVLLKQNEDSSEIQSLPKLFTLKRSAPLVHEQCYSHL